MLARWEWKGIVELGVETCRPRAPWLETERQGFVASDLMTLNDPEIGHTSATKGTRIQIRGTGILCGGEFRRPKPVPTLEDV